MYKERLMKKLIGMIKHRRLYSLLCTRPAKRMEITPDQYLDKVMVTGQPSEWFTTLISNCVLHEKSTVREKEYITTSFTMIARKYNKLIRSMQR